MIAQWISAFRGHLHGSDNAMRTGAEQAVDALLQSIGMTQRDLMVGKEPSLKLYQLKAWIGSVVAASHEYYSNSIPRTVYDEHMVRSAEAIQRLMLDIKNGTGQNIVLSAEPPASTLINIIFPRSVQWGKPVPLVVSAVSLAIGASAETYPIEVELKSNNYYEVETESGRNANVISEFGNTYPQSVTFQVTPIAVTNQSQTLPIMLTQSEVELVSFGVMASVVKPVKSQKPALEQANDSLHAQFLNDAAKATKTELATIDSTVKQATLQQESADRLSGDRHWHSPRWGKTG